MYKRPSIHVRLEKTQQRWVRMESQQRGCSVSHILREAITYYESVHNGVTPIARRRLVMEEYQALAIDLIITREHPDARDYLLAAADDNVAALDRLREADFEP
jgi:hypothetical protein